MSHFYNQLNKINQINEEDERKDIELCDRALKLIKEMEKLEIKQGSGDGNLHGRLVELEYIIKKLKAREEAENSASFDLQANDSDHTNAMDNSASPKPIPPPSI